MNRYLFLDVGFGDTFVLRLGAKTVVVDCWKHEGHGENIEEHIPGGVIDALILTHQHFDHYFGIERILSHNIMVRDVWQSPWIRPPTDTSPGLDQASWDKSQRLVAELRARGTRTHTAARTGAPFLTIDGCTFTALNPPIDINASGTAELHDGCLVVLMGTRTNPREILFCGDANLRVLEQVAVLDDIRNTRILCASHHGALDSYHEGLVRAVSPEYTIISSQPNTWGPIPDPESVRGYERFTRGCVKKTWVDGTIELPGRA